MVLTTLKGLHDLNIDVLQDLPATSVAGRPSSLIQYLVDGYLLSFDVEQVPYNASYYVRMPKAARWVFACLYLKLRLQLVFDA